MSTRAANDSDRSVRDLDSETEITLGLLDAVDRNSDVSQRSLARDLGIALGLTNAYLKRCIRKGWIKASQAPANRYAYYLTPKGFTEKGRLTTRYLASSLHFYRQARNELDALFEECATRRWHRAALAGISELAEIAMLCAMQHPVKIVCVLQENPTMTSFRGAPVLGAFDSLNGVDAIVITTLTRRQLVFAAACDALSEERVLTAPLLKIARSPTIVES